ncbi:MAG: hypothetical protein JW864_10070 [Spirochaetes bacterium]|nr:hypothetical protein [Spirochaetota bacterium]
MKKLFIILIILLAVIFIVTFIPQLLTQISKIDIMSVTGATPVALYEKIPGNITLKVTGELKKDYSFTTRTLNGFAATRIRTQEVSPEGSLVGTYAYLGIPVLHILEGIAPKSPEDKEIFDRPLDMLVTFISSSGKSVNFSYGEIIFVNDSFPVTLAYNRKEIKSSKNPEKYEKNIYKENIKGLRLICPRDLDTLRYLDDIVEISMKKINTLYDKLPVQKKGEKCGSDSISCIEGNKVYTAKLKGVEKININHWFRTGHGQGFKGISSAEGYSLRHFLKLNFPNADKNRYFLFAACDGYRCLFSGREIFEHSDGEYMIILGKKDGKKVSSGYMLAPVKDYFVDRDIWGLTHVVMLANHRLAGQIRKKHSR